jgi:hypothetical protein
MNNITAEEKNKFLTDLNNFVQNKTNKKCIVISDVVKTLIDIDSYSNEIWNNLIEGKYK